MCRAERSAGKSSFIVRMGGAILRRRFRRGKVPLLLRRYPWGIISLCSKPQAVGSILPKFHYFNEAFYEQFNISVFSTRSFDSANLRFAEICSAQDDSPKNDGRNDNHSYCGCGAGAIGYYFSDGRGGDRFGEHTNGFVEPEARHGNAHRLAVGWRAW